MPVFCLFIYFYCYFFIARSVSGRLYGIFEFTALILRGEEREIGSSEFQGLY